MFLEICQIKKSFGAGDSRVEVLKGIQLSVEKGEFCVLLGPSGSGKSTLLNIIGGIDRADEGDIFINGERMAAMKEKQLTRYRRRHLGYIFQMYNLIPNLTVRENIEVGAYLSENPLNVDELLHVLGLYDHRSKLPNQILKLIETVNRKYGNTVIMVTHNDAIKDMADRVVRMRDGVIRSDRRNEHRVAAENLEW